MTDKELKSFIIILYNYSKVLQALTEIERVCLKSKNTVYIPLNVYNNFKNILDIINKTKEELQLIK